MKTLVIIAHPNIEGSKINKTWKTRLNKESNITVHEIYSNYNDNQFDIAQEQKLLMEHDRIVFQFPFHWYNAPSLLKEWQDKVLSYGFSHGPKGDKLKGKEFMLAISAGGQKDSYQAGGAQLYTISELTKTYQAMASFTGMKFLPTFVLYGTHQLDENQINASADELASKLG